MIGMVPNDSQQIGLQLKLLIHHLRWCIKGLAALKDRKRRKINITQTPLKPPTALYTHFHDLTWITFMLAMVLRSFCAPHIPSTKIFFYDFFLHFFPTLTASTARYKQDTKKSWICFLFPLTIPTKWAIFEHRSFIKFSDFDSLPITMRPISPWLVIAVSAE
jgi:hypothetical protein